MRPASFRPLILTPVIAILAMVGLYRLVAQDANSNQPVAASPMAGVPTTLSPAPTAPAAGSMSAAVSVPMVAANETSDVNLKLRDESLDQVLALLEQLTGRSIIRPQQLPASTFTFNSLRAMTKSEAILALETLLNLNQIAAVPMGDRFLKVTPLGSARTEAPEMLEGPALALPPSGKIMSKLFTLEFLRVSEFVPQIQPLLNPGTGGGLTVFEKANSALITDSVSNLQRIELLLQKLDAPQAKGYSPKFYTLHFAKASDLVSKLHTFLSGPIQSQLGTATSYNADDRTNQIILLADPRQQAFFDDLIAKLDVKADPNTRNEVIYLKHATAKDVAALLTNLVTTQTGKTAQTASQRPGEVQLQSPSAQPPGAPAAASSSQQALGASTNEFSSLITVLADDRSNSIVVSGTGDDIRLIQELVDKIDVLLAQVSIEVVIAEVTLSDTDSTGIGAANLTVSTDTPNGPGGDNGRGTHISGFDAGVAGWNLSTGVVNPLSFSAMMSNVGSKSNVHILQANTIVTTHNKQAEFQVSQQQPIITSSQSTPVGVSGNNTSGFSSQSNVTYKDIGIDVKVTPLIGDDGSIQMTIDQKVDDHNGDVIIDNNKQPIIAHREANSFVNVQDGQMIVLGGLQTTQNSISRSKLGFLFEIPFLSNLLGGRTKTVERTELLLFVRPHIMKPSTDLKDTQKAINTLSNKDQINSYLKDPSKTTPPGLIESFK